MNNTEREKKFRKDFKPTLAKSLEQLQNIERLRFVRVIGIYGTNKRPHFAAFELGLANEQELITLAKSHDFFILKEAEQIVEQLGQNSEKDQTIRSSCEDCAKKDTCVWRSHVQRDPAKVFEENDKNPPMGERRPEYVA